MSPSETSWWVHLVVREVVSEEQPVEEEEAGGEEEEGGEEEGGHRQPHQEDGQEGGRHHAGALQGAGHTAPQRRNLKCGYMEAMKRRAVGTKVEDTMTISRFNQGTQKRKVFSFCGHIYSTWRNNLPALMNHRDNISVSIYFVFKRRLEITVNLR